MAAALRLIHALPLRRARYSLGMRWRPAFLLVVLSGLCAALATVPPTAAPLSEAGAQQQRGETLYVLACAMCHGDRLEGVSGPALSGETFEAAFGTLPPGALHGLIRDLMPEGQRGSLTAQEVLDVTAYLLRENGYALPAPGLSPKDLDGRLPLAP